MRERGVFTSSALASNIPFTVQVRLKAPMPWEVQVRVMEEPSTTGSGDSGVMNRTGKAGGEEGAKGRERKGWRGEGGGTKSIANMLHCINQFLTCT